MDPFNISKGDCSYCGMSDDKHKKSCKHVSKGIPKGIMGDVHGAASSLALKTKISTGGAFKKLPGRGLTGRHQAMVNQPVKPVSPSVQPGGKHKLTNFNSAGPISSRMTKSATSAFGVEHG